MTAVATENGSILVYKSSTLVWCADMGSEKIVSIKRGNFAGILYGALVTLSSEGLLSVGYLGSSPAVFKVPPINLARLDYSQSKAELEEMEKEISSSIDNEGMCL